MDEVIAEFNRQGIRYLLIGGQAVRLEGLPRFSMDWDLYIPPRDLENIKRINDFLREQLDVPVVPLGKRGENFVQTYQTAWGILQFHLGGPGLPDFEEALRRAVWHVTENGVQVRCLSTDDLLAAKEAAGRPEDAVDIEFLKRRKEMAGRGRAETEA
jgi:hypothetical protein